MYKQLFHFEPPRGWMNDPNGLCFFGGKYHIFYQHNPYSLHWDKMHWGHAVSDDLIYFENRPIALYPDQIYENSGGCFSGSAIEKGGKLWLFYTTVSDELGQTQSLAVSDDGEHFEKYGSNPIITESPSGTNIDFRDPKVNYFDGKYYMVTAGGRDDVGMIFLHESDDLIHWGEPRIIFSGSEYGGVLECPDFYKDGDNYFLTFSMMENRPWRVITLVGDFDGEQFFPRKRFDTEQGPDYYAPQSFWDGKRRISFGWICDFRPDRPRSDARTGALTVPREVTYDGEILRHFPIEEYRGMLTTSDPHVRISGNTLTLFDGRREIATRELDRIDSVHILRDLNIIEVFINGGEYTATFWYYD